MSNQRWIKWVHGVKEPEPPVSKSQQKRKQAQQKKARDIYTAHDVAGRTPKEASPSEPED